MDIAYDHIQEELLPQDAEDSQAARGPASKDLNTEIQEAYQAVSSSAWAAKLGGFFGSVRKQGEQYLEGAKHEVNQASEQASKGFTGLRTTIINHTRSLSLNQDESAAAHLQSEHAPTSQPATDSEGASSSSPPPPQPPPPPPSAGHGETAQEAPERPESLPADIVKEAEHMLSRFRSEAAKRLKDLEKAEDAADEALLRFGTNLRNYFRDAVSIAPPSDPADGSTGAAKILFESRDSDGKRVIHTSRLEARLHAVHCSPGSFVQDPESPEYSAWAADFDIAKRTADVAQDLDRYDELRRAVDGLVPAKVDDQTFWKRYYFLRHVIDVEEARRREMLQTATAQDEEEVAWDDDESADEGGSKTPSQSTSTPTAGHGAIQESVEDTQKKNNTTIAQQDLLKPTRESRRSNDQQSQPDSDASYDLVSGATSRTPSSPKEEKKSNPVSAKQGVEESDEDWE